MIPQRSRRRSIHALLISLILYLSIAIVLAFVYYEQGGGGFEEVVEVTLLDEKDLLKSRRETLKPPPPKHIMVPRQVQSSIAHQPQTVTLTPSANPISETVQPSDFDKDEIAHQPQTVTLTPSANPISETVQPSDQPILHSATPDQSDPQDHLPAVTTAAEQLNSRETRIDEAVSTRFQTSDGEGVRSHRQRAKGSGRDGIHALESTGVSDIGTVGNRPGKHGSGQQDGSTTGDSSSNSPFAKALRRIAAASCGQSIQHDRCV